MAATEDAAALTTNVDALEAAAAAPLPDESQIEASAEKSPPRSPRSRKADGDKPAPKPRRENGLRRGKWTVEEEAYANRLIHEFKLGLLPLTDGTTLRTFLSKLLNCDPMRISKKFVGSNCIGKQVFRRRQADMDRLTPDDIKRSRYELAELERRFLTRVAQSHRSAKSGGAGAKGVKGGDGKALGGGLMQAQQRPMLAPWLLPPHAAAGAPTVRAGAGAVAIAAPYGLPSYAAPPPAAAPAPPPPPKPDADAAAAEKAKRAALEGLHLPSLQSDASLQSLGLTAREPSFASLGAAWPSAQNLAQGWQSSNSLAGDAAAAGRPRAPSGDAGLSSWPSFSHLVTTADDSPRLPPAAPPKAAAAMSSGGAAALGDRKSVV